MCTAALALYLFALLPERLTPAQVEHCGKVARSVPVENLNRKPTWIPKTPSVVLNPQGDDEEPKD